MIISRTPLRASFCGGGTDIDSFSHNESRGGMVVSAAVKNYIHVTVNRRFDDKIRVSYSKLELVDNFEDLEHDLVREAMRITGIISGVEITTIADIPSKGTGLGSSSSVTVGLLNALHTFAGHNVSAKKLAEEACIIELDILKQPIGRQDQYAAAYGGINSISFSSKGNVVSPLDVSEEIIDRIQDEFSLVFTGISRSASKILGESPTNYDDKTDRLRKIRLQANKSMKMLKIGDLKSLGMLLSEAWNQKRGISSSVSNDELDLLYSQIIDLGASGAKLLGAGGGGFFIVHGNSEFRDIMKVALPSNKITPLILDFEGSTIIYNSYS